MFYAGLKYKFSLGQGSPTDIAGSILCAAAMPSHQMRRRDFRKEPHLQHRLFDPQLYLATLNAASAEKTVAKLATWPWFCCHGVPQYDSAAGASQADWKNANQATLLAAWSGSVPSTDPDINHACASAIAAQVELGCEAVILPAPLTTMLADQFETGSRWLDAGIAAARGASVRTPVLATVAISDNLLRGVDPTSSGLLSTIASQIGARPEVNGIYLVVEQASEQGYVCTHEDTLLSILILTDEIARGCRKSVVVNYGGSFGAVASAAGASLWASGYYVGQRRLKLSDMDDQEGRAMPRYYSRGLAGDVGLEIMDALRDTGFLNRVLTDTPPSQTLRKAVEARRFPVAAPEWQHRQSNIQAATAHYNWVMRETGSYLDSLDQASRIVRVKRWLSSAESLAKELKLAGFERNYYTELNHQATWRSALERWCRYVNFNDGSA